MLHNSKLAQIHQEVFIQFINVTSLFFKVYSLVYKCYTTNMNRKNKKIQKITLCSLFIALIAVGAFIKIPIPIVPFTLQFFFTLLAVFLLPKNLGSFSAMGYVFLGLIGIPIFSQGGGPGYVLNPSFGYLIGFVLGNVITTKILSKYSLNSNLNISFNKYLLAAFGNLATVYVCGLVYCYILCNYVINTPISLNALLIYGLVVAIPGDIILCFLASLVAKRLEPIRKELFYD